MAFSNGTVCSSPIRRQRFRAASNASLTTLVFEGVTVVVADARPPGPLRPYERVA